MGHNLEIRETGEAALMYVKRSERDVPWHSLGVPVTEAKTAKEAMIVAGLDWPVSKLPVYTRVETAESALLGQGDGEELLLPEHFAMVRDTDRSVLGVVSKEYVPIQNHEAFELLNVLVDDGDLKFETAGALRGGRQVFMTATLPVGVRIADMDQGEVTPYLAAWTSHDGSRALTIYTTTILQVCENTCNLALTKAKRSISIRHDGQAPNKVDEARKALGITFDYLTEFQQEAERMLDQTITRDRVEAIVGKLFGVKDARDERDAARQKQMAVMGLLDRSPALEGVRDTAWGAYNALTEYLDWVRPMRGSDRSIQERRWTDVFGGEVGTLRDKMHRELVALR